MILVDWKKGRTELRGEVSNLILEFTLLSSSLYELLKRSGMPDREAEWILRNQISIGLRMAEDTKRDYIIDEIYEKGDTDEIQ